MQLDSNLNFSCTHLQNSFWNNVLQLRYCFVTLLTLIHCVKVTICANYIEGGSATSSNMAVMEIFLPSGYTVDRDSLYALRRYKGIKRVDPEVGDTKVRKSLEIIILHKTFKCKMIVTGSMANNHWNNCDKVAMFSWKGRMSGIWIFVF